MSVTGYNGTLSISVAHPSIEAAGRTISKASNGDIIIHNDIFKTKVSGGGFGSEMVGRQMEQAAKLGAKRVDTYAARGGDYVGYKVWPKYGYDGELSSGIRSQLRGASELPASVRNATKISDVYKSKEGIAWWDKNGSGMSMSFDLRPGSYSMKKMASYQAETPGTAQEMIGDDVDFTAEELEDLDRAHDKYIAELEAKRADAASRRNATKRQARAEAKKPE